MLQKNYKGLIVPFISLSLISLFLFSFNFAWAKGNFHKIVISGAELKGEIEVTETTLLGFFSLSDFPTAKTDPPQKMDRGYEIKRGWEEGGSFVAWDHLTYYPNNAGSGGYIFYEGLLNGGSEYDGHWYVASAAGDAAMRRILGLENSEPVLFPYSPDGLLFGYVDLSGEVVIEPQFEAASNFSEGLAAVVVEGKSGYIDSSGQFVVEPQFEFADAFSEGLAGVVLDGKTGFIDPSGHMVIEPQFDYAGTFREGLCAIGLDGQTGFIDKTGQIVIKPQFEFASFFAGGLAPVVKNGQTGYIDPSGQMVIEPQFDFGFNFSEALAAVQIEGKTGYIDPTGTVVIKPQFDFGNSFSDGLAVVGLEGKNGYIDKSGQMVIEAQFDFADTFSEGLAAVVIEGKTGYIDPTGAVVIEPQFDSAAAFQAGIAYVQQDNNFGYIDSSGQTLFMLPLPTPALTSTTLLDFLPAVPAESRDGSCFTTSLIINQSFAWRCSTDTADASGANLFDPCLTADDSQTLVCGADPTTGEPGFVLNLTEPLPTPESTPVVTPKTSGDVLTDEMLANADYRVDDWTEAGKVKLTDGEFHQKYDEATGSELLVKLSDFKAFGDLNGDGVEDAAVIFGVNGGGSGTFVYLAAVLDKQGQPDNVAVTMLGDRVRINSIAVDPVGQITLDLITQGPSDPMCCPTEQVIWKYELTSGELWRSDAILWLLQLADGTMCSFATGATSVIYEKRLNYACSDGSWLLGNVQPGLVWTAEKVLLSETDPFTTTERKSVEVSTLWQPVDPAQLSEEIGLTAEQINFEPGELAPSSKGHLRPGFTYDPNVPPLLNGEPAHLKFTFADDPASPYFTPLERQLLIYPVEAYQAIYENTGVMDLDTRLTLLQNLLKEQPANPEGGIPVLPDMGASQVFAAQVKYLDFDGGSGVRFITHYAQDVSPIINETIFYTFQGLTDDGQYFVAFYYPVSSTSLPDSFAATEAATDYEAFAEQFDTYLSETVQTLNTAAPGDFNPNLTELDALVESLRVGE